MSSDVIELLVLFALAAVVLYRLRAIIGTRTGHEAPPEFLRRQQEARRPGAKPTSVPDIAPAPEGAEPLPGVPESGRGALDSIRRIEPEFSLDGFVAGARGAYEMILMAYEEGDRDTLRSLLAPDVFHAFEQGIIAREQAGLRVEARFIGVKEAKVDEMAFDPDTRIADITMRFVGELTSVVRDPEGRIVEGAPGELKQQKDVWTFSRDMTSENPNWLLTGTGG